MFPCLDLRVQFTLPTLCVFFGEVFCVYKSLFLPSSRCLIFRLRVADNLKTHQKTHEEKKRKLGGNKHPQGRKAKKQKTHKVGNRAETGDGVDDGKKTGGGSRGVVQETKNRNSKRKRQEFPSER